MMRTWARKKMQARNLLILAMSLFLTVSGMAQEAAPPAPSFEDLKLKWEREAEVGNFLTVTARLNSEELINAHPRYNEQSRTNMLKLTKNQTVFFLWLTNTGADDIAFSFSRMVLLNDKGEQFLPHSYHGLDTLPVELDFVIAPGKERALTLQFPKLPEPLGKVKLSLVNCRYTFVNFDVPLEWDFGPMAAKMNELRKKKTRLKILKADCM